MYTLQSAMLALSLIVVALVALRETTIPFSAIGADGRPVDIRPRQPPVAFVLHIVDTVDLEKFRLGTTRPTARRGVDVKASTIVIHGDKVDVVQYRRLVTVGSVTARLAILLVPNPVPKRRTVLRDAFL